MAPTRTFKEVIQLPFTSQYPCSLSPMLNEISPLENALLSNNVALWDALKSTEGFSLAHLNGLAALWTFLRDMLRF